MIKSFVGLQAAWNSAEPSLEGNHSLFQLPRPFVSIDVGVTLHCWRGCDISSMNDIAGLPIVSLCPVDRTPLVAPGTPIVPFHNQLQKLSGENQPEPGIRRKTCITDVCSCRSIHSQGDHIRASRRGFSETCNSNVSEQPENRNTGNSVYLRNGESATLGVPFDDSSRKWAKTQPVEEMLEWQMLGLWNQRKARCLDSQRRGCNRGRKETQEGNPKATCSRIGSDRRVNELEKTISRSKAAKLKSHDRSPSAAVRKCIIDFGYSDLRTSRVALPFCRVSLRAARSSKIPQNPHTWGDHIKKRRLELGLYQAQVALILGVTESTVTNWEKHRTNPTLRAIPKIIEFLSYDPMLGAPKSLSEELLQFRKRRGMSQKEMAKQIGIDPTTLSRLERNQGRCFNSVLRKTTALLSWLSL